jgi:hypothetical protein
VTGMARFICYPAAGLWNGIVFFAGTVAHMPGPR